MTFQIDWLLAGHILLVKSPPSYTEDDILALDQQLITYLDGASAHLMHIIYDETESVSTPGINAWTAMQAPKHPKYGWVIDVGLDGNVGFIYTLVSKILRIRHRKANSIKEAVQFLQSVDPHLPKFQLQ